MLIRRCSILSGKESERDLPITEDQYRRFESGHGHVQEIFPDLSPGDREFLVTGTTEEEWDTLFKED